MPAPSQALPPAASLAAPASGSATRAAGVRSAPMSERYVTTMGHKAESGSEPDFATLMQTDGGRTHDLLTPAGAPPDAGEDATTGKTEMAPENATPKTAEPPAGPAVSPSERVGLSAEAGTPEPESVNVRSEVLIASPNTANPDPVASQTGDHPDFRQEPAPAQTPLMRRNTAPGNGPATPLPPERVVDYMTATAGIAASLPKTGADDSISAPDPKHPPATRDEQVRSSWQAVLEPGEGGSERARPMAEASQIDRREADAFKPDSGVARTVAAAQQASSAAISMQVQSVGLTNGPPAGTTTQDAVLPRSTEASSLGPISRADLHRPIPLQVSTDRPVLATTAVATGVSHPLAKRRAQSTLTDPAQQSARHHPVSTAVSAPPAGVLSRSDPFLQGRSPTPVNPAWPVETAAKLPPLSAADAKVAHKSRAPNPEIANHPKPPVSATFGEPGKSGGATNPVGRALATNPSPNAAPMHTGRPVSTPLAHQHHASPATAPATRTLEAHARSDLLLIEAARQSVVVMNNSEPQPVSRPVTRDHVQPGTAAKAFPEVIVSSTQRGAPPPAETAASLRPQYAQVPISQAGSGERPMPEGAHGSGVSDRAVEPARSHTDPLQSNMASAPPAKSIDGRLPRAGAPSGPGAAAPTMSARTKVPGSPSTTSSFTHGDSAEPAFASSDRRAEPFSSGSSPEMKPAARLSAVAQASTAAFPNATTDMTRTVAEDALPDVVALTNNGPGRTTHGASVLSGHPSLPGPAADPARFAARVAGMLITSSAGQTEIALQPEELGRVRLNLSVTDRHATIVIMADRPETLDLMRRHANTLADTFRDLGHESVSFDFRSEGDSQAPPAHPQRNASGGENPAPESPQHLAKTDRQAPSVQGLDLRL